ncbi:hypothetical protein MKJ01_05380 [Chryseobacterium sp. SSA4.19]|uniref:hypothetical protein n=1 Tax=Chryseobacterium sp. SSA4.19 TaxID=2919915 RepID=UPI001F4D7FDC|nr:hypothetical protein [Chryseobacterium sp. SSA4.19]MCJ8153192.1 hypothetical protein [Chryseobacterium sp. SSA4.19]
MKTKINKSIVFKSAWKMVKDFYMNLSDALKKAWKYAKDNIKLIKLNIVRETEKAVAIEVYTSNGYTSTSHKYYGQKNLMWFPKSVLVNGCAPSWMVNKKMEEFNK